MYTELIIGGDTYKLRLNTRASIQLEKALGCNPMNILIAMESGNLPTGVGAVNLHAKTYLIIGSYSRFEDYKANSGKRTGCFWIG